MLDSMGNPGYRPHPVLSRALDVLFTLHAEHEMNCSTAAVRHLASSGVDVYTAVAGAPLLSYRALACMYPMHAAKGPPHQPLLHHADVCGDLTY